MGVMGCKKENRELIILQELSRRVKTARAAEPELIVITNADGELRHNTVVKVMGEWR